MRFEEKIEKLRQSQVWNEYCGYLELSLNDYMACQDRLLAEQIELMAACPLGKRFFGDKIPSSTEEFRSMVPLTRFEDYADILILKRDDMLPAKPAIWIETTWEGGDRPFKCAPYTAQMLEVYRKNILSSMILSTSREKGTFRIRNHAKVLYSLAPLPYATGLFPSLVQPEIDIRFLPSLKEASKLSFSKRCKKGFALSLKKGMNQFYGMTSIVYNMSKSFGQAAGGGKLKDIVGMSPVMLVRLLRAKYICRRDGREMTPGDVFKLDGFVCVGCDTAMYKDELEKLWGIRPLEVTGGTEPCLLGTETAGKNGMILFPDNCFYEFITERDMLRSVRDRSFIPPTYLMNELIAGEKYELVITSFKGGAFVRYRVGDIYRCLRMKNPQEGLDYPQFEYVDRVPDIIDIEGFTRITSREISKVISLAHLCVHDYIAAKEYDVNRRSFLHMYVELDTGESETAITAELFKEHIGVYFRYFDSDYSDLKRLIGVDPLKVTVLKKGSIESFEKTGRSIARFNPHKEDIYDLLRYCGRSGEVGAR